MVNTIDTLEPTTMTILPTYQCTAACKECCFECNQHRSGRIPLPNLLSYIDDACRSFDNLQMIVFSGGECFLLGDDLVSAVQKANYYKKKVRCVSNAYWAINKKAAMARLEPLIEAGLNELNLSTGDEHQEWVSIKNVINAAITGAELGIQVVITVEGSKEARFKYQELINHPELKVFFENSPVNNNIKVIENVWISFHENKSFTYNENAYRTAGTVKKLEGCSNIFNNIVINPREEMISCCGLTFEHIPELHNGSLKTEKMKELYFRQFSDFMKIWIWVDGPESILYFASQKNKEIIYTGEYVHPCQTCVLIHNDKKVKETLLRYYHEKVNDILFRYTLKKGMNDSIFSTFSK
ncbi:hypothetical protein [Priestia megaterium]|uniref:hypothetical protein n=1 Tax=Priestia megaterium TaxID=1404 RepID=UPI002877B04D|nr:hypothetical protein [Priestia megaterium]MBX4163804.1 hypothetical protein [Priestia megaterium]